MARQNTMTPEAAPATDSPPLPPLSCALRRYPGGGYVLLIADSTGHVTSTGPHDLDMVLALASETWCAAVNDGRVPLDVPTPRPDVHNDR